MSEFNTLHKPFAVGEPVQHPLVVTADCNTDVLLRAKQRCMRLEARVHHVAAMAHTAEIQVEDEVECLKKIDNFQRTAQVLQFVSHSHSLYELFNKPASKLSQEEEDLKQETLDNLQKLVELDQERNEQNNHLKNRSELLNTLTKDWDKTCALLEAKNMENHNKPDSENNDVYPEKQSMEKIIKKMSVLREILIRLIPVKSNYDFLEDKDDLLGVLHTLREPFTVESVIKSIINDVEA